MGGARGNQVLPRGEGAEGVAVAGGHQNLNFRHPAPKAGALLGYATGPALN